MDYLGSHWLALLLFLLATILGLVRSVRPGWVGLGIFALGGLGFLSPWVGGGLVLGALAALAAAFIILLFTGKWSARLGYFLGAILALGLGALLLPGWTWVLGEAWLFLSSLQAGEPGWLVLLLLISLLVGVSHRRLASLGPIRRWIALGLRCALVLILVLALAEVHARRPDQRVTVLFLWDRSLSVPPEWVQGSTKDQRQERLFQFLNNAVAQRGPGRNEDRVGVIVFGRQPRLELPPSSVPQLNFRKVQSPIDPSYTDIASALKLGLASFPEGAGRRMVLISDGNENLGSALEVARVAQQNGVQIDVLPIAAGQKNTEEIVLERLEAPLFAEKDSRLPLHVILRSYNPHVVVGTLRISKTTLEVANVQGEEKAIFQTKPILSTPVKLREGLNVFQFQQPGLKERESFTYEAEFVPSHLETPGGELVQKGLPGDRIENNRARANVLARGQSYALLIEPKIGEHRLLIDRLESGNASLRVLTMKPGDLPQDPAQLALFLNRFDTVIFANVPSEDITPEQQRVFRSNTHDQGCGLVFIGGPQSYGAGGWQGSELEKALPVTSDLKSMKIEGKSGLVLIMHASEMQEGNGWQKKIAKLAVEKLSPIDMLGLIDWNGNHNWHIPFQEVGEHRARLVRLVDTLFPGDMPDIDPAFGMSHKELTNPNYQLGTKHIILISDGDHWEASAAMLNRLRNSRITCTTVCITSHGPGEVIRMKKVAAMAAPGGRAYNVTNPADLPAIYIKETRLVSQSFVYEKQFKPRLIGGPGPTEGLAAVPDLHGFVRTTRRPSPLVEVPIETPRLGEYTFPLLAHWQYGLGKAVAFTSDARTNKQGPAFWDRDWANSEMYHQFWKQTIEWSLRPADTGKNLHMTTEHKDGKVRVTIEAQDADQRPLTDLKLQAGLTSPSFKEGKKTALTFEQINTGVYVAEFQAEEVGSYFIHVKGEWIGRDGKKEADSVRTGVTIPYSPEFAEMESNVGLLDRIAEMTGGRKYEDSELSLAQAARAGDVFRPVTTAQRSLQSLWYFLVVAAGVLLFFDVAVRRISIEPHQVSAKLSRWWSHLRGQAVVEVSTGQFLDRLKSRKSQVEESLDREKAVRRFESEEGAPIQPIPGPSAGSSSEPVKKPAPKPPAAEPEKPENYADRLLKAKKRARDDLDKK